MTSSKEFVLKLSQKSSDSFLKPILTTLCLVNWSWPDYLWSIKIRKVLKTGWEKTKAVRDSLFPLPEYISGGILKHFGFWRKWNVRKEPKGLLKQPVFYLLRNEEGRGCGDGGWSSEDLNCWGIQWEKHCLWVDWENSRHNLEETETFGTMAFRGGR